MHKRILITVFLSLIFINGSSFAQTAAEEMLATVSVICPQLSTLNGAGMLNATEQDLFFTCRDALNEPNTAVKLNAGENLTSTDTHTMNTMSVKIVSAQQPVILSRLATLRGGGASGSLAFHQKIPPDPRVLFAGPVSASKQNPSVEPLNSRMNLFANANYSTGDRDVTVNEPGFDFDGTGFTLGADYRLSNDFVVGAAIGYDRIDADIDLDRGNVNLDGYGISLFGSYTMSNLYFDLIGTYGKKDYETIRRVNYTISSQVNPGTMTTVDQTFEADTNADDWAVSFGTGYNYFRGGLTVTPQVRLNYYNSQIDNYTERLVNANTNPGFGTGLIVDDQDITSFTSNVGGQIAYAVKTGFGVVSPQLRAEWAHEFKNDDRTLTARYINGTKTTGNNIIIPAGKQDDDYFNLGASVSAVFAHGIMAYLDYATILGLEDISSHVFTAGVRIEF
jgi:outer membrane lipase/esterase